MACIQKAMRVLYRKALETVMKKIIKITFTGICFIFIALCVLYFFMVKKVQTPQVFHEIYSLERNEGLTFHVNINFPQLKNTKNVNASNANELLKNAAFSIWGKTADATTALLEEEIEDLDCFESFEVDYEILWLDERCISVVYVITSYTGGPSYTHHYMTTVDISAGKYIELNEIISIEQLTQTLRAGSFEVYTGTYSEFRDEDAHKPEEIENFIQAIKENLAYEKTESDFNRFSSQNIGLDEKNIYIYFPYNISLDGYFILCVPRETDVVMDEPVSVEESNEAEDAARVYDYWTNFSGHNFSEELGLPYADDETFEMIKTAYEQVDFFGEFELGNEEVYDEYKEKYKDLLENDRLVFDEEAGISVPFSQLDYNIEKYGLQEFTYYFFDIDGDELPELIVHHIYVYDIYVLDFDSIKNEFSVWYHRDTPGYSFIGTKKVQWQQGFRKYLTFYLLDENGKEECETFFFREQHIYEQDSEQVSLAVVMLPKYALHKDAEKEKNTELTETMKSQGIYTRLGGKWYFRITDEQYDELAESYWKAYDIAQEKIKEVTYTYDELFGGM